MSREVYRMNRFKETFRNVRAGLIEWRSGKQAQDQPDLQYCKRLLEVYLELRSGKQLLAELPEWLELELLTHDKLQNNVQAQALLAEATAYTPHKWLLEQELSARESREREGHRSWVEREERSGIPIDVYDAAASEDLWGLGFSGGGVRSATFNLGILQALAEATRTSDNKSLMSRFDYLSSVSGGGYIQQWLASWTMNSPGRFGEVQKKLICPPSDSGPSRTPPQITWLRRYSSYLTPRRGIFSADIWTMVATWFRNTFLNQIVLFFFLGLCVLLVRWMTDSNILHHVYSNKVVTIALEVYLGFSALLMLTALFGMSLRRAVAAKFLVRRLYGSLLTGRVSVPGKLRSALTTPGTAMVLGGIVLPMFLLCLLIGSDLVQTGKLTACVEILWWVYLAAIGSTVGLSTLADMKKFSIVRLVRALLWIASAIGAAYVVTWFTTTLLPKVVCLASLCPTSSENYMGPGCMQQIIQCLCGVDINRYPIVILPAAASLLFFVSLRIQIGVIGRSLREARREWLARFGAWGALISIAWIALGIIVALGPQFCHWFFRDKTCRSAAATLTVALTHFVTLSSGASSKSNGQPDPNKIFGYRLADIAGKIGAPLCILMLLLITSAIAQSITTVTPSQLFGILLVILFFFGWRVDINEFSMAGFYRNRLARCYLGGNNPTRTPDPFTGLDDHETNGKTSLRLGSLLPKRFRFAMASPRDLPHPPYDGPFPIFSTTINLSFGQDLAVQERKGASFAFTPLYSGYHVGWTSSRGTDKKTGFNAYVPTDKYAYSDGGISLANVTAISGAAANPNMGYNTQPALAFLMTLFNVRLGWWIVNPSKRRSWNASKFNRTPWFGLQYLLMELFGLSTDTTKFVCLSDGGHFDNMGLYELVRRRCRHIVICDAEADPCTVFEGIGNTIAKCRTDFGAEILLPDLRKLIPSPRTGFVGTHFVTGTIKYPAPLSAVMGSGNYDGEIIYIKTSLKGDETVDILHQRLTSGSFPQDPTANQWFDETLFECYRKLGQSAGQEAAAAIVNW